MHINSPQLGISTPQIRTSLWKFDHPRIPNILFIQRQYIGDGKSAFSMRLIGHGINRPTPDLLRDFGCNTIFSRYSQLRKHKVMHEDVDRYRYLDNVTVSNLTTIDRSLHSEWPKCNFYTLH